MNPTYTLDKTFHSFEDGSGAEALHTLQSGLTLRFWLNVKCKPQWGILQDKSGTLGFGGSEGFGYGLTALSNKADAKKVFKTFCVKVVALGPTWHELNRQMYGV